MNERQSDTTRPQPSPVTRRVDKPSWLSTYVTITDDTIEPAARALVWEQNAGCVEWDSLTPDLQNYARAHAHAVITAFITGRSDG